MYCVCVKGCTEGTLFLGTEAHNPAGLIPTAIQQIKARYPDVLVLTDVALDPYSSMVCEYIPVCMLL